MVGFNKHIVLQKETIMRSLKYLIPLPPIAWKRAGLSGKHFYDQQAHDKIAWGLYLRQQHTSPLFNRPVSMDVAFYLQAPHKNKYRNTQNLAVGNSDLDNYIKFLLDSMKEIVWVDDKLLVSISAKKVYDNEPKTVFIITEIE
jgi:Holliday junction resolvase RusA-like endonuclease